MSGLLLKKAQEEASKLTSERADLDFLPTFQTVAGVQEFAKKHGATMIDLTFVDVPGTLQHTSCPMHELTEKNVESGYGFDGSSIRGFQEIQESDMLLVPDIETCFLDTFSGEPTVSVLCDVFDPLTRERYSRSPRTIAKNAVDCLKKSGIADTAFFGPEAEFFFFDSVQYDQSAGSAFYKVDSVEAAWNTATEANLGYQIRHKEGYFPGPPTDRHQDVRAAIVRELERAGITIENFHHEVATAGQAEIDMERTDLLPMADNLIRYKYIARNVAYAHGKSVTFMPKPLFGDNGSGMHVHQSLWKKGDTLFAGNAYAGLSQMALHYVGGLLTHAKALCALCNPTTNSYKRLVPGFEAPVNFIYSARNRSAAVRIPMYSNSPHAKRIELRFPDPACNPYLAFAAMLAAGLDGIHNNIDPGPATDKNLYTMDQAELSKIPHAPHSLEEALNALEDDHDFLTKDGVFDETFLENYIAWKRSEVAEAAMRPTPWEFATYYDV